MEGVDASFVGRMLTQTESEALDLNFTSTRLRVSVEL